MPLYQTTVRTTGGRDGHAESTDGKLKVDLALPKELGGSGKGTNPEQLFGAGYAACFEGAIRFIARQEKIPLTDARVDATVSLLQGNPGFVLQVALAITTTGLSQTDAEQLVEKAHAVCPYSNATRNNIDVTLTTSAN